MATRPVNPRKNWAKWFTTERAARTLVAGYPPDSLRYPEDCAIDAAPTAICDQRAAALPQVMRRPRLEDRFTTCTVQTLEGGASRASPDPAVTSEPSLPERPATHVSRAVASITGGCPSYRCAMGTCAHAATAVQTMCTGDGALRERSRERSRSRCAMSAGSS